MKELSTEELLEILSQTKEKRKVQKTKEFNDGSVLNFIKKYNIQSGEVRVPTYRIYYEYKVIFSRSSGSKLLSKVEFFRNFNKHFTQKRSGVQRYYCINECLNLSADMMKTSLIYDQTRQRKGVLNAKKNKKIAK